MTQNEVILHLLRASWLMQEQGIVAEVGEIKRALGDEVSMSTPGEGVSFTLDRLFGSALTNDPRHLPMLWPFFVTACAERDPRALLAGASWENALKNAVTSMLPVAAEGDLVCDCREPFETLDWGSKDRVDAAYRYALLLSTLDPYKLGQRPERSRIRWSLLPMNLAVLEVTVYVPESSSGQRHMVIGGLTGHFEKSLNVAFVRESNGYAAGLWNGLLVHIHF